MNIFILSLIQREIAEYMMDKHVSKILLEAVQMLCSARRILEPEDDSESLVNSVNSVNSRLYRMAHKNHPVTIWCRKSRENFVWVLDLIEELHEEWKFRYGHPPSRVHKSYLVAQVLRENIPRDEKFEVRGLTPFALAMPDKYKTTNGDAVTAYRNYYMSPEKQRIASWKKKREKPTWYQIQTIQTIQMQRKKRKYRITLLEE